MNYLNLLWFLPAIIASVYTFKVKNTRWASEYLFTWATINCYTLWIGAIGFAGIGVLKFIK